MPERPCSRQFSNFHTFKASQRGPVAQIWRPHAPAHSATDPLEESTWALASPKPSGTVLLRRVEPLGFCAFFVVDDLLQAGSVRQQKILSQRTWVSLGRARAAGLEARERRESVREQSHVLFRRPAWRASSGRSGTRTQRGPGVLQLELGSTGSWQKPDVAPLDNPQRYQTTGHPKEKR